MNISGEILLNGKSYSKQTLKSISGYVMQDDLVHAHLTVRETLEYTAKLRMSRTSTSTQRQEMISYVINLMDISHCSNTIVGDSRVKGISGGERKRLCVAMELLTRPKLLFLDEPTSGGLLLTFILYNNLRSMHNNYNNNYNKNKLLMHTTYHTGLDSATALSVISTLKDLTLRGECTVITTIHQPQTKIFQLFDSLILMKKGNIVYQGNAIKAIDYFVGLGFPFPENTNPADYLIDVIGNKPERTSEVSDTSSATIFSSSIPNKFVVPVEPDFGDTSATFSLKEWQPWYDQFTVLLQRNLHHHWRRWDIIVLNILVTMLIGTFAGMSVWRQMGTGKVTFN
jgi:ATP-binding cassette subfamily G (WHITE) protein 2